MAKLKSPTGRLRGTVLPEQRLSRTLTLHPTVAECLQRMDFAELEKRVLRATGDHAIGPHAEAASIIFGVRPENLTESQRRAGRIVSMAILYNMDTRKTSKPLKEMLTKIFEEMPNGTVVKESSKSV